VTIENPIRVLIVDDHAVVREGLAAMIRVEPDMMVAAQASNGQEALELFRAHRPDVAILDLRLPDKSGVEVISAICRDFPHARILVLTVYDGDEDIYLALQAGARGYLLKETLRDQLIQAIHTIHAGNRCIPPAVATRLAERIFSTQLTARELEVLRFIAKGKSNKEIADLLHITQTTVKGHVNNILTKLRVSDRTEAATTALKRGIIHFE
jgi:DNA-binding NarL/FixJ family response regulator